MSRRDRQERNTVFSVTMTFSASPRMYGFSRLSRFSDTFSIIIYRRTDVKLILLFIFVFIAIPSRTSVSSSGVPNSRSVKSARESVLPRNDERLKSVFVASSPSSRFARVKFSSSYLSRFSRGSGTAAFREFGFPPTSAR